MSKLVDCRVAAARCLSAVTQGASLNQQLPLTEADVAERDRPLLRQLCYGVLRDYPKLIGLVSQLLDKPLKSKDSDILMLLLLGIYQLSETRIPDHAAVSSTVAATRGLKKPWAKNLVNGILRQWQRNQEALSEKLTQAQKMAHPKWLHKAIHKAWPNQAAAIEHANNQHPPMCLRVNQQQTDRDHYLSQLAAVGISSEACIYSNHGIRLQQAVPVDQLPGFFEGLASVQDEAPQLCVELLQLQAGHRVLDTCCAPGGKTCHILEAEPALKQLTAIDIDETRLQRVQQNLDRLQLHAQLCSADAGNLSEWWDGHLFDRVLLDAPCSATGVIRRNPDIKLHRKPQDIQQLAELQLSLLQALWPTLKPGGLLLYATCSILPAENEQVIGQFCQQQEDAEHCLIEAGWGVSCEYGRQLFPQVNGHDGFYYALLTKTEYLSA